VDLFTGLKLRSIDSLPKRSHMPFNQAAADCIWHIAVDDLVLSQEDKPKRHRSISSLDYA